MLDRVKWGDFGGIIGKEVCDFVLLEYVALKAADPCHTVLVG